MQTRRFFAFIWRVNAILILGVSLLAAVVLCILAYMFFKDATRTRHVDNMANAALGEVEKQIAELGSFEEVPGAGVLRAPLSVRQTYGLGSGSKEAGSTRNYLYFDPSSRSARWLKPSMDGLILRAQALPESEHGQKKPDTSAVVYVAVDQDSNGDHRLSEADMKRIAVSDPKGSNYRIVVQKADRLNEVRLLGTDRLLIVYSLGSKLAAVELNPHQIDSPVEVYEVQVGAKLRLV